MNNFKEKIIKFFRNEIVLIFLFCIFILFIFFMYQIFIMKDFNEINVGGATILGAFVLFIGMLFAQVIYAIEKKSEDNIARNNFILNGKLYKWLGENYISEKFIISSFDIEIDSSGDVIENLKKTVSIIKNKCDNNKENYKLLRNHLKFKGGGTNRKKIKAFIISIISTAMVTVVGSIFNSFQETNIKVISDTLLGISHNKEIIILLICYILFVAILTMVTYNVINRKNRRINYLISVLDILIEEQ